LAPYYGCGVVFEIKAGCRTPQITAPPDGSSPASQYVVLNGTADPGAELDIIVDGYIGLGATAESDGQWEAVIEPNPQVGQQHTINARCVGSENMSNTVHVTTADPGSLPSSEILDESPFLYMHKADIVTDSSPNSPQTWLYGPTYTHVALYMGGDPSGAPLIAEAVTQGESGDFGQVRTVTLEQSLIWGPDSDRVAVFRPRQRLSRGLRERVVDAARTFTDGDLSYWNVSFDLIEPITNAWLDWDRRREKPRDPGEFEQYMTELSRNKDSESKFICSTLVWRSYFTGTGNRLGSEFDFSSPNLMQADPDSFLGTHSDPAFITRLSRHFIVPDTFARSPKLWKVR
jgi:hypothetical protein